MMHFNEKKSVKIPRKSSTSLQLRNPNANNWLAALKKKKVEGKKWRETNIIRYSVSIYIIYVCVNQLLLFHVGRKPEKTLNQVNIVTWR